MAGLVSATHAMMRLVPTCKETACAVCVDGRVKPVHDGAEMRDWFYKFQFAASAALWTARFLRLIKIEHGASRQSAFGLLA
jgi:hypothetical protein